MVSVLFSLSYLFQCICVCMCVSHSLLLHSIYFFNNNHQFKKKYMVAKPVCVRAALTSCYILPSIACRFLVTFFVCYCFEVDPKLCNGRNTASSVSQSHSHMSPVFLNCVYVLCCVFLCFYVF